LLGRYPLNQPGFAQWDARLQKDFALSERKHIILSGDFFNLTNRANLYSNPDTTATIDYGAGDNCVARSTLPGAPPGVMGFSCGPLTSLPTVNAFGSPIRQITQVAPGSTPFAFQAGAKFTF
jgi:hypothetical protein